MILLYEFWIHKSLILKMPTSSFMRGKEFRQMLRLNCFPSVGILVQTKKFALRRGIWFKTLNCVERAIIDLTVQCTDSVKSVKLAKLLTAIISKLQSATENKIDKLAKIIGFPLAEKISSLALSWGNRSAKSWSSDKSFAVFLAAMHTSNGFMPHSSR